MERPGIAFEANDVVDLYRFRPPYPRALFRRIIANAKAKNHLLDIGCGHGKIAREMTGEFNQVSAVDPSGPMIRLGQSLPNGDAENLRWISGLAEDAAIPRPKLNMVTAALSLHWMDQDRLFQHLAPYIETDCIFAHIAGDGAFNPAWQADWVAFLTRWVPMLTGKKLEYREPSDFWAGNDKYLTMFEQEQFVSTPRRQSVSDFILCQHSRDTSAPSKLGKRRAQFDAELGEILSPHADSAGFLEFQVATSLTLARFNT